MHHPISLLFISDSPNSDYEIENETKTKKKQSKFRRK